MTFRVSALCSSLRACFKARGPARIERQILNHPGPKMFFMPPPAPPTLLANMPLSHHHHHTAHLPIRTLDPSATTQAVSAKARNNTIILTLSYPWRITQRSLLHTAYRRWRALHTIMTAVALLPMSIMLWLAAMGIRSILPSPHLRHRTNMDHSANGA